MCNQMINFLEIISTYFLVAKKRKKQFLKLILIILNQGNRVIFECFSNTDI